MLNRLRTSLDEKDKGFTLIELLVVVVIIGILAAIAIPIFLNQRQKAADASTKSDLKNAASLMETYFIDQQTYAQKPAPVPARLSTLKQSANVTVTITSGNASNYCLTGTNTTGSQAFVYDSGAGGLQPNSVTTCANTYS